MNRNRHYLVLIKTILLIPIMSVFLFSCGIPSFCTLNNITLSTNEYSQSFSIDGTDEDLNKVEVGPGVLLMYLTGDSEAELKNISSKIENEFSKITSSKLNIDSNNTVLTYNYDNTAYDLKAFTNTESFSRPKSPYYTFSLDKGNYIFKNGGSKSIKLANFNLKNVRWDEDKLLIDIVDYYSKKIVQTISIDMKDVKKSYISVYVAFAAEIGNFTNNYWSALKRVAIISK